MHDLSRFHTAQGSVFETARDELRAGAKRTHWMWFIFPQMRGLGLSEASQFYGIVSRAEAEAYLADPTLGPRLIELFEILLRHRGLSALAIFGPLDDSKFRSCATLFAAVTPAPSVFTRALDRFFSGAVDTRTLDLLNA